MTNPEPGFRAGLRAVAPLLVAVGGFGISYGVLADAAGMGTLAPILMSATTFAGSSQFAAASVLGAGGGAAAAIGAAVLLNSRYAPIGLSVAPVLDGPAWKRLLLAQLVVDESWALARREDGTYDRGRLVGAGVLLYVTWVSSTAIGAIGADLLGDPAALGLDAAFPALFLALVWPQLRDRRAVVAAILGAVIALSLVPLVPPGVPIVVAAAACLVGVLRR
jgi:4-azaleucine resistance transporter AzlC